MLWMLGVLLLWGCETFPPTGSFEQVTLDSDEDTTLPTAQVTWGEEGVTLTLSNAGGMNFTAFGIAQNDTDCLREEQLGDSPGCWTGEDCVYGDTSIDGKTVFGMCHTVGTRSTITLDYIDDGIAAAVEDGDLQAVDGQFTAFPDASYENDVTYYLQEADGRCWRWGLDTSYFSGLGCNNAN